MIESAEVGGDAAALRDPELVECMHETLLSIELAAFDEPVTVEMHYPFTLPRTVP